MAKTEEDARAAEAVERVERTFYRAVGAVVVAFAVGMAVVRLIGDAWAVEGAGLSQAAWGQLAWVQLGVGLIVAGVALLLAHAGWRSAVEGLWLALATSRNRAAWLEANTVAAHDRLACAASTAAQAAAALQRTSAVALPAAAVSALGETDARLAELQDLLDDGATASKPFGVRRLVERAVERAPIAVPATLAVRDDVPDMLRGDGPRLMRLVGAAVELAASMSDRTALSVEVAGKADAPALTLHVEVRTASGGWSRYADPAREATLRALAGALRARVAIEPTPSARLVLYVPVSRRPEDDALATAEWEAVLDRGAPTAAATTEPVPVVDEQPVAAASLPLRTRHATVRGDRSAVVRAKSTAAFFGGVARAPAAHAASFDGDGDEETVQLDSTQTIDVDELREVDRTTSVSLADLRLPGADGPLALASGLIHTTTASPLLRRPQEAAVPRRVLVADDDAMTRWALTGQLSLLGYSVDAVASTRLAIDAFKLRRYDAVILHTQMHGATGFEAAAQLRALEPPDHRTPFLALSSRVDADEQARCEAAGFDALLQKPVDPDRVARLVERLAAQNQRRHTVTTTRLSAAAEHPRGSRTGSVPVVAPARPRLASTPVVPVDASRLEGLHALERAAGSSGLSSAMIDGFAARADAAFEALELGVRERDPALVRITADRLWRASASLGLADIEHLSRAVAAAAGADDIDGAARLVDELRRAYRALDAVDQVGAG